MSTIIFVCIFVFSCINAFRDKKVFDTTIMEQSDISNDSTDEFMACDTSDSKENNHNNKTSTEITSITTTEDIRNQFDDVTCYNYDTCSEEYAAEEYTTTQMNNTYSVDSATEITTTHTHSFVMTSSCMYHPEEGHYEEICVAEGYTENIYEYYEMYCYYCGAVMDGWGFEELLEHSSLHGAYGSYQLLTDSIWHEPVYENVWVVDVEEYYEEEMVVECTDCGYIERSKFYGD